MLRRCLHAGRPQKCNFHDYALASTRRYDSAWRNLKALVSCIQSKSMQWNQAYRLTVWSWLTQDDFIWFSPLSIDRLTFCAFPHFKQWRSSPRLESWSHRAAPSDLRAPIELLRPGPNPLINHSWVIWRPINNARMSFNIKKNQTKHRCSSLQLLFDV